VTLDREKLTDALSQSIPVSKEGNGYKSAGSRIEVKLEKKDAYEHAEDSNDAALSLDMLRTLPRKDKKRLLKRLRKLAKKLAKSV
jgi:hypothetical protein